MRRRIVLIIFMISRSTYAESVHSLHEMVQFAFAHRSDLESLRAATKSKHQLENVQLAGYFPQVFIDHAFKTNNALVRNHHETVIEFKQLLFSLAGPYQRYHIAKFDTEQALITEQLNKDAVRFDVEQSLMKWWLTVQQEPSRLALAQFAQQDLSQARTEFAVQITAEPDFLQSESVFAQRGAAVNSYPFDLHTALAVMQRSLEQPVEFLLSKLEVQCFVDNAIVQARIQKLDAYVQSALKNRKELAIKDQELLQLDALESIDKRYYVPTISSFLNLFRGSPFVTASSVMVFWEVGVRLTWNFDGFEHIHSANATESGYFSTLFAKKSLEEDIKLDVRTSYDSVQKLLNSLDAQKVALINEQEQYALKKRQADVGLISQTELVQATNAWEQAQFEYESIKQQTALKQRELVFKCGYPQELI